MQFCDTLIRLGPFYIKASVYFPAGGLFYSINLLCLLLYMLLFSIKCSYLRFVEIDESSENVY